MPNDVASRYDKLVNSYRVSSKRRIVHRFRIATGDGRFIERIKEFRWSNNNKNMECHFCKKDYVREFKEGDRFKCGFCKKIFSIKAGTPFQNSRLSLETWFKAIKLLQRDKNTSSIKLSQELKITQKTAWMMIKKLKCFERGKYLGMDTNVR